jgi:tripartite-type tricarboxylate transporter receptor subunit TctC
MGRIKRRDILRQAIGGLSAALIACASNAYAGEDAARFPSRRITLVVPFGAGGPTDSVARLVASGLSEILGTPVIVDNRPGASTSIGATAVARAIPDGYTLMAVDISFVVTPHVFPNLGVDPLKDFKPVGQSAKSQFLMVVSPALHTPTVADFVKLAKTKPEAITIGHAGIGTTPYVAAETFINATGINPVLVSYRGMAAATNDLLAGQISALFSAVTMGAGLAKEGKVKVLGVTGAKRISELPDVPTFEESGIRMTGLEGGSWYGIVAPAKTPDDIVAKLNAALNKVAEDKEIKRRLAALGVDLSVGTPQEFDALIEAQYTYWGKTLRASGVMPKDK